MPLEIVNYSYLTLAFLILFGAIEWSYQRYSLSTELTRKIVHILSGIITLLFPFLLNSHWSVMAICGSFAILLYVTKKLNWLSSIHAIGRKTRGSYYYPLSIYLSFLAFQYTSDYIYFFLPILILALCDSTAALIGKRWPFGKYILNKDSKTIVGTLAFFLVAFGISCVLLMFFRDYSSPAIALLIAGMIAASTSFAEGISANGLDNISIPTVATTLLFIIDFGI